MARDAISLIAKFLGRETNAFELARLEEILKKKEADDLFPQMVRIHYIVSLCMKEYDIEKAKKSVRRNIKKNAANQRMSFFKRTVIAASLLFLIVFSFVELTKREGKSAETKPLQQIQAGTDRAILTLANGNQVVLEKGVEYQSEKASGNGQKLVYSKNNADEKPTYNYLTIPRGGQFKLQLSDGTEVWLNSDSKFKYPVSFIKGEVRKVELVYGELFFKVSPAADHNGASFNVVMAGQEIRVLGTEFNVRAYKDDDVMATTLVEGAIEINSKGTKRILKPDQQSQIRRGSNEIDVSEVDVSQEISWLNGLFSFEDKSLDNIMRTLARWYDVEVVFESAELKNFVFTGILERKSSIQDILGHIEASSDGQVVFEIKNDLILIK